MTAAHAFLLMFIIYRPDVYDSEPGEVRARSCEAAEAWVRAGLRPGQLLRVWSCTRIETGG